MKREDIAYYYQPIVSAVTGKIRALEALMHVEMSMLKSPEDVLRLAKEEKRLRYEYLKQQLACLNQQSTC